MWHSQTVLFESTESNTSAEERDTHHPEQELLIVEGESAYHSVCAVRDRQSQAVLAIQGKPLNAARAPRAKIVAHPVYSRLWQEICGSQIQFTLERLRYQRVVLLFDADADGIHIGALMMIYFSRYMRDLLDAGRLIVVRGPVGEIHVGDEPHFPIEEADYFALTKKAKQAGTLGLARRFRGLGGTPPPLLDEMCVHPATRNHMLVDSHLAAHAELLFGEIDEAVAQRELPL